MFDYHVHTSFSADSNEPVEKYLDRLEELGIEEFCVTEHMAVNFHRGDWMVDLQAYEKKINRLKEMGYPVKFGIEADVNCQKDDLPELISKMSQCSFDFVLASSHSFKGVDPYMEAFFKDKDPIAVCRSYLKDWITCLKRLDPKLFSCLAHVDYLAKGFGATYLPEGVFCYEYAPDEMDELLRYAALNGKGIEINTSSPQSLKGKNPPVITWLTRYRELGGEYVTLGSDAHKADRFGENISLAEEVAKAAGIRYVATFNAMEPTFHKL